MQMHVARRLSEAIGSWLHLEFCCYRAGLFSESSLKAAVGNVLSSFPISAKGTRVHADFPHAALNPLKKAGRKREVDYALVLAGNGLPKSNAEVLVEVKWADSSHCSSETIFQDFLRLAILKAADQNATCVFILAGTHKAVDLALSSMPFRTAGQNNKGIGASGANRRITFDRSNTEHAASFASSIREYSAAGFTLPHSIVTRSHGLHPIQSETGTVDFQAIAWEVESVSSAPLNSGKW